MSEQNDAVGLLADLVARATRAGADAADAVMVETTAVDAAQRLGEPERLERSESTDVGLRVFVRKRQAMASSTDRTPAALAELVERAVAMARSVPEDPYCGLAEPDDLVREIPDLDTCDQSEPEAAALVELARRAESGALGVDGVTNSEGAEANWSRARVAMAASNGFTGSYAVSRHTVIVSVLAGSGTEMERDHDYMSAVYADGLDPAEEIGRRAGEKAVRRLRPRKVGTARVPVVYDPRVANTLLGHLVRAINGTAVARGTSFLKDRLGKRVFDSAITIVDDPLRRRGLRSRPFDGEGVETGRRNLVERGRLESWILDLRSARQLGLPTTGHAARGPTSPPAPAASNLFLEPGEATPEELVSDIRAGLYVTELMGAGFNVVTGDYSRGASGFWIDNGEIAYPVSEVTVAGNARDMFRSARAANDLAFRYGTDSPTLRVEGMTVAGR